MSAEIVSLSGVRDARRNPVLDQALAYWDGIRNGRAAPSRAEIDPRGLPGILSNCFILERIAPGMGRFRVCGRHLTDVLRLELAGLPISAVLDHDSRDGFETTLEAVFSAPATARLSLESPSGYGRPPLRGQMLLMPLRDDLGAIARVLGVVTLDGAEADKPRKLVITDTRITDVPRHRPVAQRPADMAGEPRPMPLGPAQVIDLPLGAD